MSYNPDQRSGGSGNVTVNGTDLYVTEWSGGETAELKDATTTGDWDSVAKLTRGRDKATRTRFNASCKAFLDANNFQLGNIRAGTEVQNVVLNMFDGHAVTMPKAIIKDTPIESGGVAGLQMWTINIASQGPYTIS